METKNGMYILGMIIKSPLNRVKFYGDAGANYLLNKYFLLVYYIYVYSVI